MKRSSFIGQLGQKKSKSLQPELVEQEAIRCKGKVPQETAASTSTTHPPTTNTGSDLQILHFLTGADSVHSSEEPLQSSLESGQDRPFMPQPNPNKLHRGSRPQFNRTKRGWCEPGLKH